MTDETIISMASAAMDGRLHTPAQALEGALNDVGKHGAFKNGKKLLVLALDESDDQYFVSFIQAGMSMSECMALCEVAKTLFLTEMNYIPGENL